ncbi:MAG: hypothetical protein JWL73_2946, partial [Actinomycetia bacterium]|nr:hypothetical protein [Actinomycetes bacterium]
MTEIPEHLLKRSAERRKALGLPGGEEEPAAEAPAPAAVDAPAGDEAAASPAATDDTPVEAPDAPVSAEAGKIPAHL